MLKPAKCDYEHRELTGCAPLAVEVPKSELMKSRFSWTDIFGCAAAAGAGALPAAACARDVS